MKQTISAIVSTYTVRHFTGETIDDAILKLKNILEECRESFPEFESFILDYDSEYEEFDINGVRLETDDEYQKRLKLESARCKKHEEREYALYQELKAKFEGVNNG